MIKVKINKNTKTAFIIDDAESTPGASRTLTAFRIHVMPKINEITEKADGTNDWLYTIYSTEFVGDGMVFFATTIPYEDDKEVVINFDLYEPVKTGKTLDWINIGQYILAFCLGGVVGTLLYLLG